MNNWEFTACRGLDKIERALPIEEWHRIFSGSETATMSHHPAMIMNWYRSFNVLWKLEPIVISARSSSGHAVVYPLEKSYSDWRGLRARQLTPVGGQSHFDFQDPLVAGDGWSGSLSEGFWRSFKDFVRSSLRDCDHVILYRVRRELLNGANGLAEPTPFPYLDLNGKRSLDEVLDACSRSHRGDVKRQIRRLSQKGELSLRIFGIDQTTEATEELVRLFHAYDLQWRPKGDHVFMTALGRSFLEGVVRDLLPTGYLHFSVLHCGPRPIHWHVGFVFRNRFYYYKLAGDPQWSNFSPGKVHTALLIEECAKKGIRFFDFLYGAEPYKSSWTSTAYNLYRCDWWNGIRPLKSSWESLVRPVYRATKNLLKERF